MAQLNTDRATPRRSGVDHSDPVKAGAVIWSGAIVVIDSATGFAAPGSTALGLVVRGVADERVDNTGGANGAINVATSVGVYRFKNDTSVTRQHIGLPAYIVDDQTVASDNGAGTRSAAGIIDDVDAHGVWVKLEI